MLRRTAFTVLMTAALWLPQAHALGLGEITVNSALNQPLSATIPLLSIRPDEAESLIVEVAENEDYVSQGLERMDYLSTLQFTVRTDGGNPRILISSTRNARDPLLTLLLDVRAAGSRLQREYTIFLDPPELAARQPAPQAQPIPLPPPPSMDPAQSEPQPQPQASAPAPVAPARSVPVPAAQPQVESAPAAPAAATPPARKAPRTYGPVKPGETLWSIATRLLPEGATMGQMQLALYEANPTAFDRGRIGGLMKGATLDVPTRTRVLATPPDEAQARVLALRAESDRTASTPPAKPAPAPVVQEPAAATPVVEPQPLVETATPDASGEPAPVTEAPATDTQTDAATQAEAASVPAGAEDTQQESTRAVADPAAGTAPVAEMETPPAEAPATVTPAQPAPAREPLLDALGRVLPTPLLLGVLALVAALLGWVYVRRRRPAVTGQEDKIAARAAADAQAAPAVDEPQEDFAEASQLQDLAEEAVMAAYSKPSAAATSRRVPPTLDKRPDTVLEADELDSLPELNVDDLLTDTPTKPLRELEQDGFDATTQLDVDAMPTEAEQSDDPIAQADAHLGYGHHDDAVKVLREAIETAHDPAPYYIKLAEVFFAQGKAIDFMEVAETAQPFLSGKDWNKLAGLGRQLYPDHSLFQDGADAADTADGADAEVAQAADEGVLDFKLDDLEAPTPSAAPAAAAARDEAGTLDFRLDDALPDTPAAPPAAATTAGTDGLDIRLDDFDLDAGVEPADSNAISDGDEAGTKLDLARAYLDMGDNDMARSLLNEVMSEGKPAQQEEAKALLARVA